MIKQIEVLIEKNRYGQKWLDNSGLMQDNESCVIGLAFRQKIVQLIATADYSFQWPSKSYYYIKINPKDVFNGSAYLYCGNY